MFQEGLQQRPAISLASVVVTDAQMRDVVRGRVSLHPKSSDAEIEHAHGLLVSAGLLHTCLPQSESNIYVDLASQIPGEVEASTAGADASLAHGRLTWH